MLKPTQYLQLLPESRLPERGESSTVGGSQLSPSKNQNLRASSGKYFLTVNKNSSSQITNHDFLKFGFVKFDFLFTRVGLIYNVVKYQQITFHL